MTLALFEPSSDTLRCTVGSMRKVCVRALHTSGAARSPSTPPHFHKARSWVSVAVCSAGRGPSSLGGSGGEACRGRTQLFAARRRMEACHTCSLTCDLLFILVSVRTGWCTARRLAPGGHGAVIESAMQGRDTADTAGAPGTRRPYRSNTTQFGCSRGWPRGPVGPQTPCCP
jgi:hypothetical protein